MLDKILLERLRMIDEALNSLHRVGPFGRLRRHIGELFLPKRPVSEEQTLAVRLLNGSLLASIPILLSVVALRVGLGTAPTETANLALVALTAAALVSALILRSGRIDLSGFVLIFALWADGTSLTWMSSGFREVAAILPLLAVLIAFLVLPWHAGTLLGALSIGSVWLLVGLELRGLHRSDVSNPVDVGFIFTTVYILDGLVAFVSGQILRYAVRKIIATQRALFESEKELSSILQTTPDVIYRLDTKGQITYMNEAVRRYGYEPPKMVGAYLLDYVHPKDRRLAEHHLNERRTGDRSTKGMELRLFTTPSKEGASEYTAGSDFQEPIFLVQAEGLYKNGTEPKHCVGTQGIARDITDRKRAEEALRKSEEKYSRVFRAAPMGFAIATLEEARLLDVNEEFERISGYRRDELIGRSAFDVGWWVNPGEREDIINLSRRHDLAKNLEVQTCTKNGDLQTVRCDGQLIDIEGVTCLLSAVEDITDRKRLEGQLQQAQKLEAVGRLAGGIAHDFNNMLAVILGQAEMVASGLAPANPHYEAIQEIRKAAERSTGLTRQLLTFARKENTAPRVLELNQAISERLGMLRLLMGENVALKWDPSPGLWPVRMDPAHVDQILVNLSVNARDAIPDTGTLTISTENRLRQGGRPEHAEGESPGQWVLLTVTDTGTGMSEESLAHLFEPFFTTKEIGKGTGMGLATVYGIVQRDGGWIEVDSELGQGTTFRIYLPRTQGAVTGRQEVDPSQSVRGRETLLLVEDEPGILKILRRTLQRLGYTVIEAASGREALAVAARIEGPVHLILTDVIMPEMNGRDLYEKIEALHPGIRVIFMSGYSANVFEQPDGGKEHFSFLQKPFSMQELSTKVRQVLDGD